MKGKPQNDSDFEKKYQKKGLRTKHFRMFA